MFLDCLKKKELLMILLITICLFVANYIIVSKGLSLSTDGCNVQHLNAQMFFNHYMDALMQTDYSCWEKARHIISSFRISAANKFHMCFNWPRAVYLISYFLSRLFGDAPFLLQFFNIFYLTILFFCVYGLGRLYANKMTGMLAVLIVANLPGIRMHSLLYGLDIPLTAVFSLTMLILLHTRQFSRAFSSILFGLVLGIGCFVKGQLVIFLAGPLFYTSYILIRKKRYSSLVLLVSSVMLALSVSSLWWAGDFLGLANDFKAHIVSALIPAAYNEDFNLIWVVYYMKGIIFLLGMPFFLLLILSVAIYFIRAKRNEQMSLFLSSIVVSYLMFTIFRVKDYRYLLPCVPLMAIIIAERISFLRNAKLRKIFIIIMGIVFFTNSILMYNSRQPDNYSKSSERIFRIIMDQTNKKDESLIVLKPNVGGGLGALNYLLNRKNLEENSNLEIRVLWHEKEIEDYDFLITDIETDLSQYPQEKLTRVIKGIIGQDIDIKEWVHLDTVLINEKKHHYCFLFRNPRKEEQNIAELDIEKL